MSATYDATLATDLDWVRFLAGDRDIERPSLTNEEITALLGGEKNKWLAAALACDLIMAKGRNAVSKSVGDLSIAYSDNPEGAYGRVRSRLAERGASELLKTSGSHVFRNLGSTREGR